jgi:hypothetical protein
MTIDILMKFVSFCLIGTIIVTLIGVAINIILHIDVEEEIDR